MKEYKGSESEKLTADERIAELENCLDHERTEGKKLSASLVKREQQVIFLNDVNRELKDRIDSLHGEIDSVRRELDAVRREADHANSERDAIRNATFWRATQPLRDLSDMLKRLKSPIYHENFAQTVVPEPVTDYASIHGLATSFESAGEGRRIFCREILEKFEEQKGKRSKKILMVSHELNLTGAPIALYYFAKVLKARGDFPVVIAPRDGKLTAQYERAEIPVLIEPTLLCESPYLEYIDLFDAVVANTIACVSLVKQLDGRRIPLLWWIHEAATSYHEDGIPTMPQCTGHNISVFTVGAYAHNCLKKHRPLYSSGNLIYYIPDDSKKNRQRNTEKNSLLPGEKVNGKVVFCLIGVHEHRKGQDILLEAIENMTEEEKKQTFFVFVGKRHYDPIEHRLREICEEYPDTVLDLGELDRDDVLQLYGEVDCLICASRDDPMPIVATEAMMFGKCVICSEHTGTAKIVQEQKCGLVYRNDDKEELLAAIRKVLSNGNMLREFGGNGRKAYLNYFSEEQFRRNALKCLDSVLEGKAASNTFEGKICVSVVIPTYNAGTQFKRMLKKLNTQKLSGKLEIVVVDSGSSDGTPETAERCGAKLYRIPHKDFSHSYARNFGVEKAQGNVILFMTQDALPIGEDWVASMIAPIVSRKVAAVSARELCPESTEMFFKISSRSFSAFLGVDREDKFNRLSEGERLNQNELRIRSNLSDVSCAIDRGVFDKYRYRYDFAEDLDMGMRLIRDGYTILLSSNIRVLHGHNRKAGYYLKRSLVDILTLGKMLPDIAPGYDTIHNVSLRICSAAEIVWKILEEVRSFPADYRCQDHTSEWRHKLVRYASSPVQYMARTDMDFGDDLLNRTIYICAKYCDRDPLGDQTLLWNLNGYLESEVEPYLSANKQMMLTDERIIAAIDDCVIKQLSVLIGLELSKLRWGAVLHEKFADLMEGV